MFIKFFSSIGLDLGPTSWVTLRYAITSVTGLLLSILFARLANKETYGSYQYMLSFLSVVSVISFPGLTQACLKAVVGGDNKAVARAVHLSFWLSWLGSLLLLMYAWYSSFSGNTHLALVLAVAAIGFPFLYAPNAWYTYYHGRKIYPLVEAKLIVSSLGVFVLLALGLWFKLSVTWLIFLYLAGTSLFAWTYFFQAKKEHGIGGAGNIRFPYAFSVTLQKFILGLTENIPTLLVGGVFGFAATALYQLAYFPLGMLGGYLGGLIALRLPRFFEGERLSIAVVLLQNIFLGLLLYAGIVVFLFWLFLPIYGEGYRAALTLAWQLSFLALLLPLKVHLTNFLSVGERNKEVVLIYTLANLIAFSLTFLTTGLDSFGNTITLFLYTLNISTVVFLLSLYSFHRQHTASIL